MISVYVLKSQRDLDLLPLLATSEVHSRVRVLDILDLCYVLTEFKLSTFMQLFQSALNCYDSIVVCLSRARNKNIFKRIQDLIRMRKMDVLDVLNAQVTTQDQEGVGGLVHLMSSVDMETLIQMVRAYSDQGKYI